MSPFETLIERPQWYVKRFSNPNLTAGASFQGIPLQMDYDAPFRCFGYAIYVYGSDGTPLGASGNIGLTARFTRPDQTWMQKRIVSGQQDNPYDSDAAAGFGQPPPFFSYFSPLGTNILYPPGSTVAMELQLNAGVSDALVMMVFLGTKLYRDGQVWNPIPPDKTRKRPYFGYDLQPTIPSKDVPLLIDRDAGFVWQGGTQTPGDQLGFGVKFKDYSGKYYMNDFVPADLIFGYNNAQTPGLIYPEIYIPKNQALYFDFEALP